MKYAINQLRVIVGQKERVNITGHMSATWGHHVPETEGR